MAEFTANHKSDEDDALYTSCYVRLHTQKCAAGFVAAARVVWCGMERFLH